MSGRLEIIRWVENPTSKCFDFHSPFIACGSLYCLRYNKCDWFSVWVERAILVYLNLQEYFWPLFNAYVCKDVFAVIEVVFPARPLNIQGISLKTNSLFGLPPKFPPNLTYFLIHQITSNLANWLIRQNLF